MKQTIFVWLHFPLFSSYLAFILIIIIPLFLSSIILILNLVCSASFSSPCMLFIQTHGLYISFTHLSVVAVFSSHASISCGHVFNVIFLPWDMPCMPSSEVALSMRGSFHMPTFLLSNNFLDTQGFCHYFYSPSLSVSIPSLSVSVRRFIYLNSNQEEFHSPIPRYLCPWLFHHFSNNYVSAYSMFSTAHLFHP